MNKISLCTSIYIPQDNLFPMFKFLTDEKF